MPEFVKAKLMQHHSLVMRETRVGQRRASMTDIGGLTRRRFSMLRGLGGDRAEGSGFRERSVSLTPFNVKLRSRSQSVPTLQGHQVRIILPRAAASRVRCPSVRTRPRDAQVYAKAMQPVMSTVDQGADEPTPTPTGGGVVVSSGGAPQSL